MRRWQPSEASPFVRGVALPCVSRTESDVRARYHAGAPLRPRAVPPQTGSDRLDSSAAAYRSDHRTTTKGLRSMSKAAAALREGLRAESRSRARRETGVRR